VTGEGDVLIVDESVDRIEALRAASRDANVFYLLGTGEVLPLMDASVEEIVAELELSPEAAAEIFRVLRPGGTVTLAGQDGPALNLGERMLGEAGFTRVTLGTNGDGVELSAQKP
jgi:ubiquinone/menaquinone biosynthesis C-methylase UbiE